MLEGSRPSALAMAGWISWAAAVMMFSARFILFWHRPIGWIGLLIRRRMWHVGGQQALRLGDGGLDILRGGIDVARQRELHVYLRRALGILGAHALHARDGGELALERRGHR